MIRWDFFFIEQLCDPLMWSVLQSLERFFDLLIVEIDYESDILIPALKIKSVYIRFSPECLQVKMPFLTISGILISSNALTIIIVF